MVFTLLDRNCCMVYEPVIIKPTRLQTVHIRVEAAASCRSAKRSEFPTCCASWAWRWKSSPAAGTPIPGSREREQWHSGTNFFALAPGQVMGYGRNNYTIEELDKHGFRVIHAQDVISGETDLSAEGRCVVTIDGEELARGGGGCRCMTMPIRRAALD